MKAQRAIRYVDLTLVPDAPLLEVWEDLDPTEQRMYRAAILQELFDDSYEELGTRLKSSGVVAREAGFDPNDIPSDTTLWRGICDLDEDVIKEAARRANNAVLHATLPGGSSLSEVSTDPGKPQFYYEITKYDREISTDQKMQKLTRVVAEYMELAIPHIDFGRDPSAPNYQYPPESFYRLLAHTALEDCYPEKGAELFRWLSDDDVDVPGASTLYRYAEQFDVDEHAERFLDATCALLERDGLPPLDRYILASTSRKCPGMGMWRPTMRTHLPTRNGESSQMPRITPLGTGRSASSRSLPLTGTTCWASSRSVTRKNPIRSWTPCSIASPTGLISPSDGSISTVGWQTPISWMSAMSTA